MVRQRTEEGENVQIKMCLESLHWDVMLGMFRESDTSIHYCVCRLVSNASRVIGIYVFCHKYVGLVLTS